MVKTKKKSAHHSKHKNKTNTHQNKIKHKKWHIAPLKGSFMVTAILGILLSYYYVLPIHYSFGVTCIIIFTLMFIASLVSMTKAPITI